VEAATRDFYRAVLERATVHRHGTVVTVRADVASGLNTLLALYGKEMAQGNK